MSIKRNKSASRGKARDEEEESPFMSGKKAEPAIVWADTVASQGDDAFVPYAMGTTFAKGTFITHTKFGKGVVTGVEGTRIEVLFEEGPKKLGHASPG